MQRVFSRRGTRSALAAVVALVAGAPIASAQTWAANLSGPSEAPPNASPGVGTFFFTYNPVAMTMRIQGSFSGLTSNTAAAHIHCCTGVPQTGTAGVATTVPTLAGFPLGVTSGSLDQTYDWTLASSFNPVFVTAQGSVANARTALLAGMTAGTAYLNVHTTQFPGGEIRGFTQVVPEPSTVLLTSAGLVGLAVAARRRRKADPVTPATP